MSKRASGPPRRPRNPIAREVRSTKYRPRLVPDKRWPERLKDREHAVADSVEDSAGDAGRDSAKTPE